DAAEPPNRARKLVSISTKEDPVKVSIKSLDVHAPVLPRGGCAQNDRVPRRLEERLAVIVPHSVHHSKGPVLLTLAYEVDNDVRRGIEIGENLLPVVGAGTHKLIKAGVLEWLDERQVVVARGVLPVHHDHVFRNIANQIRMMKRDVTPEHQTPVIGLQ